MKNLEIRILNGLHHRARCRVEDGARIGTEASCDVVLMDAGLTEETARVQLAEQGWALVLDESDLDEDQTWLPFNTAAAIGPIFITVAHPDDPWLDGDAMRLPTEQLVDPTPDTLETTGQTGDTLAATPQQADLVRQKSRAHTLWIASVIFSILVGGGVAVAAFSPSFSLSPDTSPPAATFTTLQQVRRALQTLGISDRTEAALSTKGVITVTGWVQDDTMQKNLSAALAKIWPAPFMRVNNEQGVAASIHAQLADLKMPIALEYPKGGVLKIKGIAANEADRLTALQRLAAQQNDIPIAAVEILSAAEVQSALIRAARDADLPAVALTWDAGVLTVKANHFNTTQRNHLTSLITALNKRYLNVFMLEQGDSQGVAMNIPFRIHSIIGGSQPWLILENGTKLVVGGTYDHYRLKAIEDSRVIFEAENSTAGDNTAIITR